METLGLQASQKKKPSSREAIKKEKTERILTGYLENESEAAKKKERRVLCRGEMKWK